MEKTEEEKIAQREKLRGKPRAKTEQIIKRKLPDAPMPKGGGVYPDAFPENLTPIKPQSAKPIQKRSTIDKGQIPDRNIVDTRPVGLTKQEANELLKKVLTGRETYVKNKERESWRGDDPKQFDTYLAEIRLEKVVEEEDQRLHNLYKVFVPNNGSNWVEYEREDFFPADWMDDIAEIIVNIERFIYLIDIMNYVHEYTRGKGTAFICGLQDDACGETHGPKKYPISLFVTGKVWYEACAKAVGCKPITVRKYIQEFIDRGVYKQIGKKGNGLIIKDGYFAPMDRNWDRFRKISLIKKERKIIIGLIEFQPKYNG